MQISRKTGKTIVIVVISLMISVMLFANVSAPLVQAAEVSVGGPMPAGVIANVTVPTVAYLSFRPNPVGLNQPILVNFWLVPAVTASRVVRDYSITFVKPDGTKDVIKMDGEPATTANWFEYVVDQVGDWKIKLDFPGTYFNGTSNQATQSAYYNPASTGEQILKVQQDFVWSWPPSPLPTDYWTRPVDFVHREWWPILGNWPSTGYDGTHDPQWSTRYPDTNPYWSSQYDFTPWVQAPNTAHIVWSRQTALAGLSGGQTGPGAGMQVGGSTTGSPDKPDIIYAGRAYQAVTKPASVLINGTIRTQPTTLWQCYDIRTGQVYWELTDVNRPTIIEYNYRNEDQTFATSASVNLLYLGNARMEKYNPFTGALTANISISPLTGSGGSYYKNRYCLAIQDLGSSAAPNRYRLINWTTAGTSSNFTSRILSNTTYARSSLPNLIDWNAGLGAQVSGITIAGAYSGITAQGFDLMTGQSLWNSTLNDETQYSGSCAIADHGKVVQLSQRGYYVAWDLRTGNIAWKSEKMDYPWGQSAFGAYSAQSAYGMFFRESYDAVYAFDWDTGKIVWKYHSYSPAAFESPYTDDVGREVFSDNTGAEIVDGKFYSYNCEHTQTWPRTRGWKLFCLNVTTGEELWSIGLPGGAAFGDATDIGGFADGYMSMTSAIGYMYYFGKGKSATTVTAPDVVIPKGNGIVIKGTVLDMSPAQPNTPCVSKESMKLQMEHIHLQTSIGGLWGNETVTGVPVTLTAMGSDGTYIDIGTVTTNGYYGTFAKEWTPPAEGTYEIIASFAGDESYGSSAASTTISIGPATAPIEIPEQVVPPDYTMTIIYAAVAIIVAVVIAIAIVGIVLYKKPK